MVHGSSLTRNSDYTKSGTDRHGAVTGWGGNGCQPAMDRAHACA